MGCHLLFQGIFPTQGSNPRFLFLHWQVDSLPLSQLLLNTSHYGWNIVVSGLFYASLENNFYFSKQLVSGQFSSVAQSCLILCDPMDCRTPGLPVLHCLPEFAQTHVHQVGDAIQPSHPLSSPSPPTFNLSQLRVFSNELALCQLRWSKYWSFSFSIIPPNEYSGLISFRIDRLDSPCCPGDSQESSPTPQFKSINSLVLSFLHSPTLTSIHDHWKNHSFD